jgi:hypothetical protein
MTKNVSCNRFLSFVFVLLYNHFPVIFALPQFLLHQQRLSMPISFALLGADKKSLNVAFCAKNSVLTSSDVRFSRRPELSAYVGNFWKRKIFEECTFLDVFGVDSMYGLEVNEA